MARLVTADDLCVGVQTVLTDHLEHLVEQLGWHEGDKPLLPVTTWTQLPTREALTTATFPAGAIDSPGLASTPSRRGRGGVDATWRIGVGVYDRGADHGDTAGRVRRWAAAVRACVLQHPTLDGTASSATWVGEEYAEIPLRQAARTIGGCAVAFDVTATNVVDVDDLPTRLVESTHLTVSGRLPAGSQ
ncbi:hypothetical protein ACOACO_17450 [Nocardioides sp. CPCC 205120]|uniref:hypothetical protein n=1 Tax=Nocardioides sp. CPCC 205120 TaxID=3406462 RepID=UPI003B50415C